MAEDIGPGPQRILRRLLAFRQLLVSGGSVNSFTRSHSTGGLDPVALIHPTGLATRFLSSSPRRPCVRQIHSASSSDHLALHNSSLSNEYSKEESTGFQTTSSREQDEYQKQRQKEYEVPPANSNRSDRAGSFSEGFSLLACAGSAQGRSTRSSTHLIHALRRRFSLRLRRRSGQANSTGIQEAAFVLASSGESRKAPFVPVQCKRCGVSTGSTPYERRESSLTMRPEEVEHSLGLDTECASCQHLSRSHSSIRLDSTLMTNVVRVYIIILHYASRLPAYCSSMSTSSEPELSLISV
ncbi:unnamed protein product [Protopolystoma xenopodis]|uniref:Uncharacterized protein n=1 Tax=Protopolystoma xenopodis TaxID=117903 RepID=A0A448WCP2_9PLAT|nr:unnamed protein product [Protopolystoma xenopodis]